MKTIREDIGELLEQWNRATHREKAEIEELIWQSTTKEVRRSYYKGKNVAAANGRTHLLRAVTGDSGYAIGNRQMLRACGPAADVLWRQVDEYKMALTSACGVLVDAKKMVSGAGSLGQAIEDSLAEHLTLPESVMPDGRVIRRRSPGQYTMKQARKKREKAGKPSTHATWTKIRKLLGDLVADKLRELDRLEAARFYDEFESDLKVLIDSTQAKISAARRHARETRSPSMVEIAEACATLAIDEPRPGHPIDLVRARRNQRSLAGQYHPDKHGGSEHMREQYQTVIDAYGVLVRYNEELRRPVLTVVQGGKGKNDVGRA